MTHKIPHSQGTISQTFYRDNHRVWATRGRNGPNWWIKQTVKIWWRNPTATAVAEHARQCCSLLKCCAALQSICLWCQLTAETLMCTVVRHKERAAAGLAVPHQHPDGLRRMCEAWRKEYLKGYHQSSLCFWFLVGSQFVKEPPNVLTKVISVSRT